MLTDDQLNAALPLYLDGGDGSMWQSRSDWAGLRAEPDTAARHWVRASDVLAVLNASRCLLRPMAGGAVANQAMTDRVRLDQ